MPTTKASMGSNWLPPGHKTVNHAVQFREASDLNCLFQKYLLRISCSWP
jgi:hypothetical protein